MNKLTKIKKAFQMKTYLITAFSILLISLTGCDYFENSDTLNSASLEVNITGLPAIPDTMTYVAWYDNDKTNFDPIKVFAQDGDANGNIIFRSEQPMGHLIDAQSFIITIEREAALNDSGFAPSSRVVLSGRFKTGNCVLDLGEAANQLNDAAAIFTLTTPTNGTGTDELSGVWFIDSLGAAPAPVAGLKLPVLYNGWRYEGWAEINGTLVSTGRFTDPEEADLFDEYSSTTAGYPFPGEDFLQNAPAGLTFPTDLTGQKVFISLERNDGSTSGTTPFVVLFSATVQSPAQDGVSYTMQRTTNSIPGGTAVIKADLLE